MKPELSDRMRAWFTPNMLISDQAILDTLRSLAEQYDTLQAEGTLTVGKIDEIFLTSDRLQAELWRRHVTQEGDPELLDLGQRLQRAFNRLADELDEKGLEIPTENERDAWYELGRLVAEVLARGLR